MCRKPANRCERFCDHINFLLSNLLLHSEPFQKVFLKIANLFFKSEFLFQKLRWRFFSNSNISYNLMISKYGHRSNKQEKCV